MEESCLAGNKQRMKKINNIFPNLYLLLEKSILSTLSPG